MEVQRYIMAIDQGTTSTRALIINHQGECIASAQTELTQFFPEPGWVEQDANEIWQTVQSVIAQALINGEILPQQIAAIGLTNQRETTVIWDRSTGIPIYRAIVWQSRQSQSICQKIKEQGLEKKIQSKTGLPVDPYFSASKIRWILDHVEGAQAMAEDGHLAFGTIETWMMWKLSGGQRHITDYTNASRTLLFNIESLEWDEELLKYFNIPRSLLPEVVSNSQIYGKTATYHFYGHEIPLAGMAGDQQAALIGQLAFNPGQVKSTYGTGAFILMNIGDQLQFSNKGLTTSIAYRLPDRDPVYCLEGSIFVAGSAVQWLRDGIGLIEHSDETEALANESSSQDEVYLVPAFTGLGAPYWDPKARGALFGLTRGTTKADLAKATLQSMAYQVQDILEAMTEDTGIKISELRVDGGAARNNYLMQFQADLIQCQVIRPANLETTALGAAYLAGLAVGYWESIETLQTLVKSAETFENNQDTDYSLKLYQGWKKAVNATRSFSQQEGD